MEIFVLLPNSRQWSLRLAQCLNYHVVTFIFNFRKLYFGLLKSIHPRFATKMTMVTVTIWNPCEVWIKWIQYGTCVNRWVHNRFSWKIEIRIRSGVRVPSIKTTFITTANYATFMGPAVEPIPQIALLTPLSVKTDTYQIQWREGILDWSKNIISCTVRCDTRENSAAAFLALTVYRSLDTSLKEQVK